MSHEERLCIIRMSKMKMKQRDIAASIGCTQSAVSKIIKKYKIDGCLSMTNNRGSKQKLDRLDKLRIKRIIQAHPTYSAVEILRDTGLYDKISKWTVYRYLNTLGLFTRVAKTSSITSRIHRMKRRVFANKYKNWTDEEWSKVVFSDETSIKLTPKWRILVRRPINARFHQRYVLKSVYYDKRSVMFWGCICADGTKILRCVTGTMNSIQYTDILRNVWPNFSNDMILQQDRAPCHFSKHTRSVLNLLRIQVLEPWPPCSPDLNPIENFWSKLKLNVKKWKPKSKHHLIEIVNDEFNKIETDFVRRLCLSMKKRLIEVCKVKGRITRY